MDDTDIFGVKDPVSGQIGYCCVLGAISEVFALCVYRGAEGLDLYLRIISQALDPEIDDLFAIQNVLMAEFVDRGELDNDDMKVIKTLGLKFRGRNNYPRFRSHSPGYYPWRLTGDEVVFLTFALECACDMAEEYKKNPRMLEPTNDSQFLTYLSKGKNGLSFEKKWLPPEQLEERVITIPPLDQLKVRRIRKMNLGADSTWEVDTFYSNKVINEGERPYWIRLSMVARHSDGVIIKFLISSPDVAPHVVARDCFLDAITETSAMPEKIFVKDNALLETMQPLAKILGFRFTLVDELPAIMDAKVDLLNMS
jgi:hypothetical protein